MFNLPEQTKITDKDGNALVFSAHNVRLILMNGTTKNGKTVKDILSISDLKDGRRIFYKRFDPSRHLMRINNSVGFNYEAIKMMNDDDILCVRHFKKGESVYASVSEAREKGSFLHFKEKGFERQFFVQLKDFKKEIPQAKQKDEDERTERPMEARDIQA